MLARQGMNLKRWYGNSVRIPDYNNKAYIPFVANCVGIVNNLVERTTGKRIRVAMMKGGTASADQSNMLIKINEQFVIGYFKGYKEPRLDVDKTISAILGIIVHEAAHFAYSPKDLTMFGEYVKEHTARKYIDNLAMSVGNVVEDLFIEAEVGRTLPNLFWMLESATRVLLTDAEIAKRTKLVKHVTQAPAKLEEVVDVFNWLVLTKVPSYTPQQSTYLMFLFDMLREAQVAYDLQQRFEITLAVYDALMENFGKEKKNVAPPQAQVEQTADDDEAQDAEEAEEGVGEEESGEGSRDEESEDESGEAEESGEDAEGGEEEDGSGVDDGEDSESDEGEGAGLGIGDEDAEEGEESENEEEDDLGSDLGSDADDEDEEFNSSQDNDSFGEDESSELSDAELEDALKQALEDALGLTANHDDDSVLDVHLQDPTTTFGQHLNEELNANKLNMLPFLGEGKDEDNSGLVVERTCDVGKPMEMDKRYVKLAEMGRQRATVNRPYGEDKVRGTNIRRLHRIATDGKIFAERVPMSDYRPMQVVILIDASGSMNSGAGGSEAVTRIQAATKAALGACYGLMEGRCEVAIYAHTADCLFGLETLVYVVKEFNQGLEGLDERLQWLVRGARKASNRDGMAIKHVSTKFTRQDRRRVIIVISDGMPSAVGYSGDAGIGRTAKDVAEVRAKGIDVLSISIAPSAKEPNDKIYGVEANVYNNDPNVIEEIVERLMKQPGRR